VRWLVVSRLWPRMALQAAVCRRVQRHEKGPCEGFPYRSYVDARRGLERVRRQIRAFCHRNARRSPERRGCDEKISVCCGGGVFLSVCFRGDACASWVASGEYSYALAVVSRDAGRNGAVLFRTRSANGGRGACGWGASGECCVAGGVFSLLVDCSATVKGE